MTTLIRTSKQSEDVVIIQDVRNVFCAVVTPCKDGQDEAEKYKITLIINKQHNITPLQDAFNREVRKKWGEQAPRNIRSFLIDGDVQEGKKSFDQTLKGHWYMHVKSSIEFDLPALFDEHGDKIQASNPKAKAIFYSGCYVNVGASLYAYEFKGKCGVGLNIISVQKVRDGERISKRGINREEFLSEFVTKGTDYEDDIQM